MCPVIRYYMFRCTEWVTIHRIARDIHPKSPYGLPRLWFFKVKSWKLQRLGALSCSTISPHSFGNLKSYDPVLSLYMHYFFLWSLLQRSKQIPCVHLLKSQYHNIVGKMFTWPTFRLHWMDFFKAGFTVKWSGIVVVRQRHDKFVRVFPRSESGLKTDTYPPTHFHTHTHTHWTTSICAVLVLEVVIQNAINGNEVRIEITSTRWNESNSDRANEDSEKTEITTAGR